MAFAGCAVRTAAAICIVHMQIFGIKINGQSPVCRAQHHADKRSHGPRNMCKLVSMSGAADAAAAAEISCTEISNL